MAHALDEVDPEIAQTLAQPHKLMFRLDGKRYVYTPDTELWTERGHFVREIKEEGELRAKLELTRKFDEVARIYALAGIRFQLLTDHQIRLAPASRMRWPCRSVEGSRSLGNANSACSITFATVKANQRSPSA